MTLLGILPPVSGICPVFKDLYISALRAFALRGHLRCAALQIGLYFGRRGILQVARCGILGILPCNVQIMVAHRGGDNREDRRGDCS